MMWCYAFICDVWTELCIFIKINNKWWSCMEGSIYRYFRIVLKFLFIYIWNCVPFTNTGALFVHNSQPELISLEMLKFSFYPLCKLMVKCVVEMFSNWQLWIKMKSMILENAENWSWELINWQEICMLKKEICWQIRMWKSSCSFENTYFEEDFSWKAASVYLYLWVASFAVTLILIPTTGIYWLKY